MLSNESEFFSCSLWVSEYLPLLNITYLLVKPYITKQDTRWQKAVPTAARLITYLLYVTQGMAYHQISLLMGFIESTICRCIHDCAYAICKHMFSTYIRLPTLAEWRTNMEKWRQQTSIPGIVSAIDGTHINIEKLCECG